jgi:hypothetical protein
MAIAKNSKGTIGILYIVYNGLDQKKGFPTYTANLAISDNHGLTFTTHPEKFLSPAKDDGDQRQRVLGDYEQLKAVGTTFYGVRMGLRPTHGDESALLRFIDSKQVTRVFRGSVPRKRRALRPSFRQHRSHLFQNDSKSITLCFGPEETSQSAGVVEAASLNVGHSSARTHEQGGHAARVIVRGRLQAPLSTPASPCASRR